MATYYLDLENGNDAADGLSFANRWKTFSNGPTAARTAPGDTIRVMASRPKQSLGLAAWVDNTKKVTFATSRWKLIDNAESGWTASANVTITYQSANTRVGAGQMILSVASAFTTGKAAYKTLAAPLDLSAFQQLSFFMRQYSIYSATSISIKLCSDTIGDVPVDSFEVTGLTSFQWTQWASMLVDKAAALGSAINSIAIYVDLDPGAAAYTLYFNNFVAVLDKESPLCITNLSIISKQTAGEPEWYPVHGFLSDTEVILGGNSSTDYYDAYRNIPWRGVSETVETWVINTIPTTNLYSIVEGGTAVAPIHYSFGWDRATMSTRDGITWMHGRGLLGYPWVPNTYGSLKFSYFGVVAFYSSGIYLTHGARVENCEGVLGCGISVQGVGGGQADVQWVTVDIKQIWQSYHPFGYSINLPIKAKVGRVHGMPKTGGVAPGVQFSRWYDGIDQVSIGKIDNCYRAISQNNNIGTRIRNCVSFENNSLDVELTSGYGDLWLDNCAAPASAVPNITTGIGGLNGRGALRQSAIGGNPHRHQYNGPFVELKTVNDTYYQAGLTGPMTSFSEDFELGNSLTGAWIRDTSWASVGTYSIHSNPILDGQTTDETLAVTLTNAGTLQFDWKTDTEANYDKLYISIDGGALTLISSGNTSGTSSFPLTSGAHTIVFRYGKDGSGAIGADRVWVDNIRIVEAGEAQVPSDTDWSWRLDIGRQASSAAGNFEEAFPFTFPLAKFIAEANKLVTAKCWIKKASDAIKAGLFFRDFEIAGIVETASYSTGADGVWQEVTITGTPTVEGIMTVYGGGWASAGISGNYAWFDKITISQVA